MLLAIDIGNTNIVTALFEGDDLKQEWRIHTDANRTGDEYFSILLSLFRDSHIRAENISCSALSSVVPALIGPFVSVSEKLTGKKPLVVSPKIYDKLPVKIPSSAVHEIGTDLLCNAVEAWSRFKSACIVVDFGTALTFTTVDDSGTIAGISITPGLGTALHSLFSNTAQLPSVPLVAPPSSLGKNTAHAIQSGIVLGYKWLVEGLITQIKHDLVKETGAVYNNIHVIATGGLNSVLQPITDVFEIVDKTLTLHGLLKVAEYSGCAN
ncbi:MAG: type III pantothenate kinase [Treponema sp.]|nr:type III pantothenate kinase [Treponema sp.]